MLGGHEICLQLSDRARELETVPGAWTRHQYSRVSRVEVDDEIVVRRIGEETDRAFSHFGLRELGQDGIECGTQRLDLFVPDLPIDGFRIRNDSTVVHHR